MCIFHLILAVCYFIQHDTTISIFFVKSLRTRRWVFYYVTNKTCIYVKPDCNQLILWFTLVAHPNIELKNPTFLGQKNEVLTTASL